MQYVLPVSVSHRHPLHQISHGSQLSQSPPPCHSQSVQQNAASQASQLSLVGQVSQGHFSSSIVSTSVHLRPAFWAIRHIRQVNRLVPAARHVSYLLITNATPCPSIGFFNPPPMPNARNFYGISIVITPFAIYETQMTSSKVFSHFPSFLRSCNNHQDSRNCLIRQDYHNTQYHHLHANTYNHCTAQQ